MTRRFTDAPVAAERLERLLDLARRVPSAGFAQGVDLLVATTTEARGRVWAAIAEDEWARSPTATPLRQAAVVILPVANPGAYTARYGEPDKAGSDLSGVPADRWPTPYWLVDASFSVLALLLAAEDEGLGALFFRLHRPEDEVLAALDIPADRRLVGAICLGESDRNDAPSGSPLRRDRRALADVVHRERW